MSNQIMTLQSRITKLETKITQSPEKITWVDLVRVAEGENPGFSIAPLLEFFKDENESE
jgi:hypothetical protein